MIFLLLLRSTLNNAWQAVKNCLSKLETSSSTLAEAQQAMLDTLKQSCDAYASACDEIKEDYTQCLQKRDAAQEETAKIENYGI